jgi:hypothetical protein
VQTLREQLPINKKLKGSGLGVFSGYLLDVQRLVVGPTCKINRREPHSARHLWLQPPCQAFST